MISRTLLYRFPEELNTCLCFRTIYLSVWTTYSTCTNWIPNAISEARLVCHHGRSNQTVETAFSCCQVAGAFNWFGTLLVKQLEFELGAKARELGFRFVVKYYWGTVSRWFIGFTHIGRFFFPTLFSRWGPYTIFFSNLKIMNVVTSLFFRFKETNIKINK